MSTPKVYIILVNWRNPYDTIECLESLLRVDYRNHQVVVCDNGSGDNSMEVFREWSESRLCPMTRNGSPGADFSRRRDNAPEPSCAFARAQLGGTGYSVPTVTDEIRFAQVVFVEVPENRGFAAGNNVGIRYALEAGDGDLFWLLNNDTVVAPDALGRIVEKHQSSPQAGMLGTTVYHYHDPERIQYAAGAAANRWLASVRPITDRYDGQSPIAEYETGVERKLSYVVGASLIVTRPFLEQVGLMSEDYFLYYEEQDWVARMPTALTIAFASQAVVFHKEGASIGGKTRAFSPKSITADRYASRSRILFTLRHSPWALPMVLMAILAATVRRISILNMANAVAVVRGATEAFFVGRGSVGR